MYDSVIYYIKGRFIGQKKGLRLVYDKQSYMERDASKSVQRIVFIAAFSMHTRLPKSKPMPTVITHSCSHHPSH